MLTEPLTPGDAKRLLVSIIDNGTVDFSPHAYTEMAEDGITVDQVLAVMRGGVVEPAEFERGSWRYRVRQARTYVVVTFRSETRTVVVTAWRKK
jgi:hypothetical protein